MERKIIVSAAVALVFFSITISAYAFVAYVKNDYSIKNTANFEMTPITPDDLDENVEASGDYYVSINGSDTNNGTMIAPFRTIEYAKMAVNKFKDEVNDDMNIIMLDGTYILRNPLRFTENDNLPNEHKLSLKAYENSQPVISGGTNVTGWEKVKQNGIDMYRAYVPEIYNAREFYVNNKPRNLAKTEIFAPKDLGQKVWDYTNYNGFCDAPNGWIPRPAIDSGIYMTRDDLYNFSQVHNAKQMEFCASFEWRFFLAHCEEVITPSVMSMADDFRLITERFYIPGPGGPGTLPTPFNPDYGYQTMYFQNDISLIKNQGDFCYDNLSSYLYYYPKNGEDITKQISFVPRLDDLVVIEGTQEEMVKNINISGITFMHSNFTSLGLIGISINQADNYEAGIIGGEDSISGATLRGSIYLNRSSDISITDCRFQNMVSTAINCEDYFTNSNISNNIFENIGGCPISMLVAQNSNINNNIIRNYGTTIKSSVGIIVRDGINLKIENNDLLHGSYTGISFGYGWGGKVDVISKSNSVSRNKIGSVMEKLKDGGGLYTLDKLYDTTIEENYIFDVIEGSCIYNDDGTRGVTVKNNVLQNVRPNSNYNNAAFVANIFYKRASYENANGDTAYYGNYINGLMGNPTETAFSLSDIIPFFRKFPDSDDIGQITNITNGTRADEINIEEYNNIVEKNAKSANLWSAGAKKIIAKSGLDNSAKYLYKKLEQSPKLIGNK